MAETFLTPADLAQRIGYSVATLARWRIEGSGPPFMKPGAGLRARVRYRLSDVEAWERRCAMTSTGQAA
ncbi:putative DNA-binding transcriptional regulator AlpA [Caulobacter sp. BE264]|jgi:hypothetical protein|uniref:helix-turn-helix transcriptional regulator n=1 Tax=Caulobacter sp. BE264 TaxID=2817724 RepID=UPI00285FA80F|nr:helix-turn-helix domain-containing protein [Caulobacter sp. BE264]MDR7229934.1 putative DNA-binding transcriptional regulator AlpA [Caulobacter sp. BE264]